MAFKDLITNFGNLNLEYQTSKSTKIPLQKKKKKVRKEKPLNIPYNYQTIVTCA